MFSSGSLEDVNISELQQEDSSSSLSTDWNDLRTSEMYVGQCVPLSAVMPSWLSATDCDPSLLDSKLDAVYCRGISSDSHRSLAYQPAVYVNCCYRDCYHFRQCCVQCKHVGSASATDSPNVGRGVSGVLPTAARAALYFPASPADDADSDPDPYSLLTRTADNSMSSRSLGVRGGCKATVGP